MSPDAIINPGALEPLFGPADIPNQHRVRADKPGGPAKVVTGRRPSPITIAQNLRRWVADWRESDYPGASDTTRELLYHWFHRDHVATTETGDTAPFQYYFCQREAIETLMYLYEVRGIHSLSSLTAEYGGMDSERAALGVSPEEDRWPRYAFKVATGAGKTKIMSLAMVWSYFHALRESDSPLTKHFVVIAPSITVFERLKEDFGNGRIFDADPLIPLAWRGDWNLSVTLQDEANASATGGTLYLTNIHRLYDTSRRGSREPEMYGWMGPKVSKTQALDTSEELRKRITQHPRVMLLNDEAHHVWDPGSAWNEAIQFLHDSARQRGGNLVAQLDFSATPKDDRGQVFKHTVCDTPLGEAVDAGIVKTPVLGHGEQLTERHHDNAAFRYENHLLLGYRRWEKSHEEWEKSGKKPLLFVMTEDTGAADEIANRLNTDPLFPMLNGRTVNLHTNLKGKLRPRGRGSDKYFEFVEDEKAISDEDLKKLRKLSRELDTDSHYRCIVSVLMLREGWDVRNVTTIVPLRPLTAKSRILPEQTLGRGLRRMVPGERLAEVVTVVEHKAFLDLYREQLSQEGLPIEGIEIEQIPKTTVTIYIDEENKDVAALELLLPRLSQAYQVIPQLDALSFEDVRKAFDRYDPLPLREPRSHDIRYEGRHLITDEIIEQMIVSLPLLKDPIGAISFFREELERATRLRGLHAQLAPLIQQFLEELLFGEHVSIHDDRVAPRLAEQDVREHVRAVFLPLVLQKTTRRQERVTEAPPVSVASWKPFQVTHSERHPTEQAKKTPFNLVPCTLQLEVAMAQLLDRAEDVAAFAKNAGPQALRIDYLNAEHRRATYTPDFLVRKADGGYLLVETKGRMDADVPYEARAAVEWCKAASSRRARWSYVLVPQATFERFTGSGIDDLVRASRPALERVLKDLESPQLTLSLGDVAADDVDRYLRAFVDPRVVVDLPPRYRKAIEDAVTLFHFQEHKPGATFGPVFQPLLGSIDHAAEQIIVHRLSEDVPTSPDDQRLFFGPDVSAAKKDQQEFLKQKAGHLKKLLVHRSGVMPTGVLSFCLGYAKKPEAPLPAIFSSVRRRFGDLARTNLQELVDDMYAFRNTYVAHEKATPVTDAAVASQALARWIQTLTALHAALP